MHGGNKLRDLLITAAVAAVLAGGAAWQVQDWRYSKKVSDMERAHAVALQQAEAEARQREQLMQRENERISHEASKREQRLAANSAAARSTVNGLRDDIARLNARPAPADPVAAANAGEASTARELLGACAAEHTSMAGEADQLRDQVIGLQDWVARVCQGGAK